MSNWGKLISGIALGLLTGGGLTACDPNVVNTTVSGVASIAPLQGTTVSVYTVKPNGTPALLIGRARTDASGAFTIAFTPFANAAVMPLYFEASGGFYVSPSGNVVPLSAPLKGYNFLSQTQSYSVSAFSHLAYARAQALLAAGLPLRSAIRTAQAEVAQAFAIPDIRVPPAPAAGAVPELSKLSIDGLATELDAVAVAGGGTDLMPVLNSLANDFASDAVINGMLLDGTPVSPTITPGNVQTNESTLKAADVSGLFSDATVPTITGSGAGVTPITD